VNRRWVCSALLLLAGCAPAKPAATAPSDDEWTPLTWEERHDVMTFTVLPNMGRLFQRLRRTAAPDLTCRTCHGADAEARSYRMPASLPPLDRDAPTKAKDADEARMVNLMVDEVTPAFSALIGKRATCFSCHAPKTGAP
jgi:hypothetical protein